MKSFLLTGILFVSQRVFAQSFWDGVTVKYSAITPSLNLTAKSPDVIRRELQYKPSTLGKIAFGFDYKNYGATLSTAIPRDSEFRHKYGEGQSTDFQFRYSYDVFYIESYYQQYKGYYLDNASDIMPNPYGPNGEYPQNSSLKVEHYGVLLFKFLNPEKFHPKRALELTEKPKGSGGSWYYVFGLNTHKLRTAESLVPSTATGNYLELGNLRSTRSYTLSAGGGGAYSWVFGDSWVLTGFFGISLGNQWGDTRFLNHDENKTQSAAKTQTKFLVGYSGEKFLAGFSVQGDSTQIVNSNADLTLSSIEATVFAGWRF